jgi:hypothetical protein
MIHRCQKVVPAEPLQFDCFPCTPAVSVEVDDTTHQLPTWIDCGLLSLLKEQQHQHAALSDVAVAAALWQHHASNITDLSVHDGVRFRLLKLKRLEEVVSTVLRERRIQDGNLRAKLAEAKHPANVAGAAARNCPVCSAGMGSVKLAGMPEELVPDATYLLKVRGRNSHSLLQRPVVYRSLQVYLHRACCRSRQTPV